MSEKLIIENQTSDVAVESQASAPAVLLKKFKPKDWEIGVDGFLYLTGKAKKEAIEEFEKGLKIILELRKKIEEFHVKKQANAGQDNNIDDLKKQIDDLKKQIDDLKSRVRSEEDRRTLSELEDRNKDSVVMRKDLLEKRRDKGLYLNGLNTSLQNVLGKFQNIPDSFTEEGIHGMVEKYRKNLDSLKREVAIKGAKKEVAATGEGVAKVRSKTNKRFSLARIGVVALALSPIGFLIYHKSLKGSPEKEDGNNPGVAKMVDVKMENAKTRRVKIKLKLRQLFLDSRDFIQKNNTPGNALIIDQYLGACSDQLQQLIPKSELNCNFNLQSWVWTVRYFDPDILDYKEVIVDLKNINDENITVDPDTVIK